MLEKLISYLSRELDLSAENLNRDTTFERNMVTCKRNFL